MKLFVLGLDGATFDCLNPLMEEGVIPNLKEICTHGAWGPLQTVIPPVTAPAWLALATGLNPGKTGVFDYINKKTPEGNEMVPVSSAYYRDRSVWELLGSKNFKVGIFNYPTLSPAPRVNGFAVSGMGGYRKLNLSFPEELETELHEITGGYEFRLNLRSSKYRKDISLFLDDVNRVIAKQSKALKYLVTQKEWDFFFAVFHFTDWMQHLLWKDIDDKHPLYNPILSPRIKARFKDTWTRIDEIIGELLRVIGDIAFMIVSDHGAGPIDSAFYPNTWLAQKHWLKKNHLGWRGLFAEKFKPLSADIDNKYLSAGLHILKTRILKTGGTMDLIDLENSLAYSPEHAGMFGCINLTKKGKEFDGFREDLIQEIKDLPRNINGIDEVEIYLPEQIYSGPYVNLAPDILFIINGYRSTVEIDFTKSSFVPSPSIEMRTGSHRPQGVFMAKGDIFKNVRVENISVLDIAPTILALYNIEIPSPIDGRVITNCLKQKVLKSMKIKKIRQVSDDKHQIEENGDLEEMKRTLKSLGYM